MRGSLTPFLLVVILGACSTNPGRTTGIGAGTGAALGAGLGAIVGAGAGDSGTGIALGTIAGTAAGTFVGNSIEGQDNEIASQGEVIRAQDRALMSQRAELERLRTQLGDGETSSNLGGYPVAEQPWGQNVGSVSGAPGRSMSFKEPTRDPNVSTGEAAGLRSRADFGDTESRSFDEDTLNSDSADGHVFISKSKKEISSADAGAAPASLGNPSDDKSSVQFSHGKGDFRLSASHPANRFTKYHDSEGEVGSPSSARGGMESKVASARYEPSKEYASKSEPPAYPSVPPKRGRGAIEEKSRSVPVVDNAQGEDEKALSAPRVSRNKTSEAINSNRSSAKSGSVFEEIDKVDESKSEGALTASDRKECQDATKELARAGERALPADKLFHLRRALRLCPEDSRYHLELAALYRSLGRDGDAIYEYHEAARVDPDNQEAMTALKELGSSAG